MGLSEASICNLALSRIGQKEFIASLADPSTSGQLCAVAYPASRDTLLGRFNWPFATKHAVLAQLMPAPNTPFVAARSGWTYCFALPTDFVQAQYIFSGVRPGASLGTASVVAEAVVSTWVPPPIVGLGAKIPFAIEGADDGSGELLFCDFQTPELIYTSHFTSPPAFPPLFVDALVWLLASELALGLPVKSEKWKLCRDM